MSIKLLDLEIVTIDGRVYLRDTESKKVIPTSGVADIHVHDPGIEEGFPKVSITNVVLLNGRK